jgi:hypothetical protein
MALGIVDSAGSGSGGGDFTPIVKWDAKGGDFTARNRAQTAAGVWENDDVDVQMPVKLIADLENIEVGWVAYVPTPSFVMTKIGGAMPAKPSDDHKMGFRVRLYSDELGLRELSSAAKTVVRALDELHDQYVAEATANEGKVPVVEIKGGKKIKVNTPGGELSFKVPDWSIVSWTDRPQQMDGDSGGSAPEMKKAEVSVDTGDIF